MSTPKAHLVFIITCLILSSCYGKYIRKEFDSFRHLRPAINDSQEPERHSHETDEHGSNETNEDDDDWPLSTGAIIGIAIAGLVISCIPIILCYCCAWCCFASLRRSKPVPSQVVLAAPATQYVNPSQTPEKEYPINRPSSPLNQSKSDEASAPYTISGSPPVPPYSGYNGEASALNHDQPPPYYDAISSSNVRVPPEQRPI